jgi:methyltransferase (TIGR00027 family)
MTDSDTPIKDVSDTSLWVAYYRALESKRKDALFKDPLAETLVGEQGKIIAEKMKGKIPYVEWTVIIRTVVIDEYIRKMVQDGVDTILNLGAGMDTRPYRMKLPSALKWIEVDYPHIIAHKNTVLKNEKPVCQLSRIELDLADIQKRTAFFEQLNSQSKKVLILTEGVVVYLTEEQVSGLANDLIRFPSFTYWVVEYLNPEIYPRLKDPVRQAKLKNAPFQFFPADWTGFFEQRGWIPKEVTYHGEMGAKLNRPMPFPRFTFLLYKLFMPKIVLEKVRKMTGFLLLERKDRTRENKL